MMNKYLLAAAVLTAGVINGSAENYDTMYLVKGDHVVGKYKVSDVDYATFTLPQGVSDENIMVKVDNVGKNNVTYTVSTVNPFIGYAHNVLSFYDIEMMALQYLGNTFDNLDDETKKLVLQETLSYNAYVGVNTRQFTQTDFQLDGTGPSSRYSVMPGTRYYLCAWEIDPVEQTPMETFVSEQFQTVAPEKGKAVIDCSYVGMIEQGVQMSFTGSDVVYVRTCWGMKDSMDPYIEKYGYDYTMGMFGQNWDLEFLQGSGELGEGIPNSIWPAYDSGDYVMFVDAYDADGNVTRQRVDMNIQVEGQEAQGPDITIFSKDKKAGYVSVNFEISPSNVAEAYVRLCGENFTDDRLNMGYTLGEIAMGGDAEDITSIINTTGEYTYTNSEVDEEWKSLLIYAKDKEGNASTLRINFYPDTETEWSINKVERSAKKALKGVKRINDKRNPTMKRVSK